MEVGGFCLFLMVTSYPCHLDFFWTFSCITFRSLGVQITSPGWDSSVCGFDIVCVILAGGWGESGLVGWGGTITREVGMLSRRNAPL